MNRAHRSHGKMENVTRKADLEYLGVDGRIILKWILNTVAGSESD
jgi:hypothetical protein